MTKNVILRCKVLGLYSSCCTVIFHWCVRRASARAALVSARAALVSARACSRVRACREGMGG